MYAHYRLMLLATIVACGVTGCSPTPISQDDASGDGGTDIATIYVVNYPLKYFAERIGGQYVEVTFPAPPGVDPAIWTPDAEAIVAYQQADLILLNGTSYASWTQTVSLPETRTVDTSAAIADQGIEIEDAVTHTHGPGGEHAHGELAFTTWLDPKLAIEQSQAIADALSARWPEHKPQFDEGLAALKKDLLDLDAAFSETATRAKDNPLLFSHPVYQYFERRYGLTGKSVHWEPDELPSDQQWSELAEILNSHPAKWMIWEAEPEQTTVTRLGELGIESVVLAPCGNTPKVGDYIAVMKQNASRLAQALGSATLTSP